MAVLMSFRSLEDRESIVINPFVVDNDLRSDYRPHALLRSNDDAMLRRGIQVG
jgi:hypothetical protein